MAFSNSLSSRQILNDMCILRLQLLLGIFFSLGRTLQDATKNVLRQNIVNKVSVPLVPINVFLFESCFRYKLHDI